MKIKKMDHFCIAVKDLDAARKVWEPILGKEPDDTYVDEPEKIRVARYWLGGVGFELMESTAPDGPVAQWIEKHGEGIMLIGLNVESTREAIAELEAKGYPFVAPPSPIADDITGKARPFRDCEFALMHPRKTNGVMVELIDYKWKELESL
ncbi:methylmalonyl-CoA epimerase [Syntrophus gentianae]|uniref:Methylmalonyl-CoA epimerase n=1 Tax=Syntrophus gentianae TaxID=43775 RepID=A0A1H7ZG40_9BACT|nr:VOC family protein [Syntrophus gentianae]SEM57221.1 methylmalonyl-CoA epimerase [Syntrophus gentianae]